MTNLNFYSKDQLLSSNQMNIDKKSYESTINHLKSIILKEKKKVRELKNIYMKEIGSKSEL